MNQPPHVMNKSIVCIAIAVLFMGLVGCSHQKATIQGLVKLDGIDEIGFSGFKENPIWGIDKEINIHIDSTRTFNVEVDIEQISDCWMQFGMGTENATSKRIFISPGDKLELIINETGISFNGKGAEINKLYSRVEANGLCTHQLINSLMHNHISLEAYIENVKGFQARRRQLIEDLDRKDKLSDKLEKFYNDQTDLDYRFLITALFRHSFYTDISSVNLFKMFKNEISVDEFTNDEWVTYHDYISLLKHYLFYVKGLEISRNSSGVGLFEGVEIALTDSLKGLSQQYALAEYIYSNLDNGKYDSLLVNHFNNIARDEFAKKTVTDALDKYEQKEYLIGKPLHEEFANTVLTDTANNPLLFGEMLESYKGNIVYMEVWSLSCGPCLRSMPTARMLEKEMGNLPVKFVYLTTDKLNNTLWKHVFKASLTKENHYRLVNGTNSRMNKFMHSTLVPWYLLFDKQGNLLDFHAEDPYTIKEKLIALGKK